MRWKMKSDGIESLTIVIQPDENVDVYLDAVGGERTPGEVIRELHVNEGAEIVELGRARQPENEK